MKNQAQSGTKTRSAIGCIPTSRAKRATSYEDVKASAWNPSCVTLLTRELVLEHLMIRKGQRAKVLRKADFKPIAEDFA
jgi:hypothetical protein